MHETLNPNFIGNIDFVDTTSDRTRVRGWTVGLGDETTDWEVLAGEAAFAPCLDRPDVADWYRSSDQRYMRCGFDLSIPYPGPRLTLRARTSSGDIDLLEVQVPEPPTFPSVDLTPLGAPQMLVVDDFYRDPDAIREFALRQDFGEDRNYFRGHRTKSAFLFPGLKERFETLLNTKIKRWDDMPVNGVFQYCTSQDALVYHADSQNYAAAIYLTPDAPPSSGTTMYRSRAHTNVRRYPQQGFSYGQIFPTGHFDRTKFEMVDLIGNVYNRLVLWDAKLLHSASEYFGDRLENARLFHLFFFDI